MNIHVIQHDEELLKFAQDHNSNVDRYMARFIKNPIIEDDTSQAMNKKKSSEPKIVVLSEGEKATPNMYQLEK